MKRHDLTFVIAGNAMRGREQAGSVLFLILVAVALFAALSYAMMQGSRTSSSMMGSEQAKLYATETIAYGDAIKQAVQKLRLRGVPATGLSFENDVFRQNSAGALLSPSSHFPNCTNNACKVFHPEGGGIHAKDLPKGAFKADRPFAWQTARTSSLEGIGTPDVELTWVIAFIRKEVCIEINKLLGVHNPDGKPPQLPAYDGQVVGTYAGTNPFMAFTRYLSEGLITGQRSYCFQEPSNFSLGETYGYITTLIAR